MRMLLALLLAAAPTATPALLEPGEPYHGDETRHATPGPWLALLGGPRPRLAHVTVGVRTVHDPIVDQDGAAPSGKRVTAPAGTIFLARGLPALRPGPVQAAVVDVPPLEPGGPWFLGTRDHSIRLGRHAWTVATVGRKGVEPTPVPSGQPDMFGDAALVLLGDGRRQVLYALPANARVFRGNWRLVWAGDLDRDGRPDLYVEASSHENVTTRRLFLSGAARPGELVREVATFETVGC